MELSKAKTQAYDYPTWPHFSDEQISAVVRVLKSGKVNAWTGSDNKVFEQKLAELADCKHAIATSNGTVSLEIALAALGIGKGDEVIVTPRSFLASTSCVVRVGATPVFADVDTDSQNITAKSIEAVITKRTRAVLPVHLAGWPCEMVEIADLAQAFDLKVVEDCAQAHGAMFHGRPVGSFGDIASWSFCQDKIISTGGEGGALAMNSDSLWSRTWSIKEHGKSFESMQCQLNNTAAYQWRHHSLGTNARLSGIQAAIGVQQMSSLESWLEQRNINAQFLWSECRKIPGIYCPEIPENILHACYQGYIYVMPEALKSNWSRDRLLRELRDLRIPVSIGSCPEIYREKMVIDAGFSPAVRLPNAKQLGETSLAMPVHPRLEIKHMNQMVNALKALMFRAVKQSYK